MADKNTNFWSAPLQDPKRAFRFVLTLGSFDNIQWLVKKVSRPEIEVQEAEHAYLNHTFYYPGRVKWSEVNFTLVDPITPDAAEVMSSIIQNAGYSPPKDMNSLSTMDKASAISELGELSVDIIDATGDAALETWTFKNAWLLKVTFSEHSYEEDALTDVELTVRYDWAELISASGTGFFELA